MPFRWAANSHPGLRRSSNEDSHVERPDLALFVVADGMGGHVAGEVASRAAVEAIEGFVRETVHSDQQSTWPYPFETDLTLAGNRLKISLRLANRRIGELIATDPGLRGMATTASALLIDGRTAIVAHVGDSRAYLFRGGELRRLTYDHSWVEEQVRAGTMSANLARTHPWRNVVTRALTGGEDPEVDVREMAIEPGDQFLLCSDGLVAVVPDDRIRETLASAGTADAACQVLVDAANKGGGPDNITVLVVQIDAP
jgi:protein phosphatase